MKEVAIKDFRKNRQRREGRDGEIEEWRKKGYKRNSLTDKLTEDNSSNSSDSSNTSSDGKRF